MTELTPCRDECVAYPCVARGFLDLFDPAGVDERLTSCLRRRHSRPFVFRRDEVDVRGQLVDERLVDFAASNEVRPETANARDERSHVDSSAARIAPATRVHSSVSAASWRRPAFVSA